MISLRTRSAEPEIMDDLDCHGDVVDRTLRELEIINRLLGGDEVTTDGIARVLKMNDQSYTKNRVYMNDQSYTIADFGCGGGDLAMKIVKWGRKRGLDLTVTGIDANPHIVEFARKTYPGISFVAMDVFENKIKYDIITATLFIHHFTDDQLVRLFKLLKEHSRIGVVINDIHRHFVSYYSIRWLTQLFSKSAMVKFDAPLSVRRAFRKQELIDILERAGIKNYQLKWKWAFRWQVVILA